MIEQGFFNNLSFVTSSLDATRQLVSEIDDDLKEVRQILATRDQRKNDFEELVQLLTAENECLKVINSN
jgi:hypothetical protein